MVEPTAEVLDVIIEEIVANEEIRLARVWEICRKRLPYYAKDDKEQLDWFCLAMGMPLAKEKERFPIIEQHEGGPPSNAPDDDFCHCVSPQPFNDRVCGWCGGELKHD